MVDGLPRVCRSAPAKITFLVDFQKIVWNYKVLASRIGLIGSVRVPGWLAKLVCETSLSLAVLVVISLVDFLGFSFFLNLMLGIL